MTRTYETHITFRHPFAIHGYKDILIAGTYKAEVEEERIENLSFTSFRRKQVSLHLKPNPKRPGITEILVLSPHELDAAITWDRRKDPDVDHSQPRTRLFAPPASRAAIERGENEGMLWIRDAEPKPGRSNLQRQTMLDDDLD